MISGITKMPNIMNPVAWIIHWVANLMTEYRHRVQLDMDTDCAARAYSSTSVKFLQQPQGGVVVEYKAKYPWLLALLFVEQLISFQKVSPEDESWRKAFTANIRRAQQLLIQHILRTHGMDPDMVVQPIFWYEPRETMEDEVEKNAHISNGESFNIEKGFLFARKLQFVYSELIAGAKVFSKSNAAQEFFSGFEVEGSDELGTVFSELLKEDVPEEIKEALENIRILGHGEETILRCALQTEVDTVTLPDIVSEVNQILNSKGT